MKKNKILEILSTNNIEYFTTQNVPSSKISKILSEKLGENNTPSPTAINNYIEKYLQLHWNTETKTWIPYEKNDIDSTISKKKGSKKTSNDIVISHESAIDEEDNHVEEKTASSNQTNENIKTKEKSTTICSTNKNNTEEKSSPISNINQNKAASKKDTSINTVNFKDENINVSEYAEYITALGNEKFSLSLSRFVIELVEQRISKKYSVNPKKNRSKIIQLALLEYLRLTK